MSAPAAAPAIGVGWTGASGLVYGVRLVEVLLQAGRDVHLVASDAVAQTAPVELEQTLGEVTARLQTVGPGRLRVCGRTEFTSPLASGSARGGPFVVVPCSMGTAARIAAGTSETLLLRAADVCLKERRTLILVPRETPMATHHLENLARLSARGALVLPAAPGFYHRPQAVGDLVDFIVQRICDHLAVEVALAPRWGEES
ncbi:MAG: UbiX family flavin prenyltransferase [Candidatus Krumholzibacteriia bacterium]